eukprot:359786-Chlamydomonas_euryale.AAC.4
MLRVVAWPCERRAASCWRPHRCHTAHRRQIELSCLVAALPHAARRAPFKLRPSPALWRPPEPCNARGGGTRRGPAFADGRCGRPPPPEGRSGGRSFSVAYSEGNPVRPPLLLRSATAASRRARRPQQHLHWSWGTQHGSRRSKKSSSVAARWLGSEGQGFKRLTLLLGSGGPCRRHA